jgi:hypothetical protein
VGRVRVDRVIHQRVRFQPRDQVRKPGVKRQNGRVAEVETPGHTRDALGHRHRFPRPPERVRVVIGEHEEAPRPELTKPQTAASRMQARNPMTWGSGRLRPRGVDAQDTVAALRQPYTALLLLLRPPAVPVLLPEADDLHPSLGSARRRDLG